MLGSPVAVTRSRPFGPLIRVRETRMIQQEFRMRRETPPLFEVL